MHIRMPGVLICIFLLSLCVAAIAADISMNITVSPKVLILSAPTTWITIHSNMQLSAVNTSTLDVAVNGNTVPIGLIKADARGQMVLKVRQTEVDEYVVPSAATFVVTGATKLGATFIGSDTIIVKE